MNIVKQMLEFLPEQFISAIKNLNMKCLYEIRMRAEKPTRVRLGEKYVYLTNYGVSDQADKAIVATREDLEETVLSAGKYSVYSVEEQLKQGFLTGDHGERIGIAGRYVFENGQPVTVRDFTSLCIRIPHEIIGCARQIYRECLSDRLLNLLIVSPPGQGKTTILRDLSRVLCDEKSYNVLICDERGEISGGNVGKTADVFSYADKKCAFGMGIRVMRPDVIITDELSLSDLPPLIQAKDSGVKVIASFHASTYDEIPMEILAAFDAIALISSTEIGKIVGIRKK